MLSRNELSRRAARAALQIRNKLGCNPQDAVSPIDVAESLGVEVRFVDIGSLEGLYLRDNPATILLSSHRPPGRQAFTCGHELGHHVFNHSTRIEKLVAGSHLGRPRAAEEVLADAFSGFLLMPRAAMVHGFTARGWTARGCQAEQSYAIARWLGVGYETLVYQMRHIKLVDASQAMRLLNTPLKAIRASFWGEDTEHDVIPVDTNWSSRPVDVQMGDLLILPLGTECDGMCIEILRTLPGGVRARAIKPGICRIYLPSSKWASFVRVSRRSYVGRGVYRHLEEIDDG